jgi:hypothetical protein
MPSASSYILTGISGADDADQESHGEVEDDEEDKRKKDHQRKWEDNVRCDGKSLTTFSLMIKRQEESRGWIIIFIISLFL